MSNLSGTYMVIGGQVQKVSEAIPTLKRNVFFNKGGVPRYDPSARETFFSKAHKRQWLKANGLREGGLVNPKQRWDGPTRNTTKCSPEAKRAAQQRKAQLQSHGGVSGLLDRIQQGKGNFL